MNRKFEYKIFEINPNRSSTSLLDELNYYGYIGWDIIHFEPSDFSYVEHIWMKREIT